MNKDNLIDITLLCENVSSNMTYIEPLITIDDFSMFDAMNALELMDPKMDASCGINIDKVLKNIDHNEIPILNASIVVSLIKLMIINEVAFIDGASLLESTHQCLLLWEGYHQHPHLLDALIIRSSMPSPSSSSIYDRVLIAYSKCLNKCLTYINNAILDANIYEDEDFQPSTVPTLSNTDDEILINDMNSCIKELNNSDNNDDKKLLSLLISRLNQLKFFATYHDFINYATIIGRKGSNYGSDDDTNDDTIILKTIELHAKFKHDIMQLLESLNKVDNDDNDDNKDSCAFFFDPNPSKLQQTSAIRTIFFKSFSQSLVHIKGII